MSYSGDDCPEGDSTVKDASFLGDCPETKGDCDGDSDGDSDGDEMEGRGCPEREVIDDCDCPTRYVCSEREVEDC